MKIELHPTLQDYDPLDQDERAALKKSLKKSTCQHPVLIWEDGPRRWLMDGFHRKTLCDELGITYPVKFFKGTEKEAVALARSLNDDRRHRTPEQRAFAAARRAQLPRGVHDGENSPSLATAAKEENVSVDMAKAAKAVLVNGTPVLQEAAESGEVSVFDAASVSHEPPKVQNAAVKAVRRGAARTARAAVGKSDADESREELTDQEGHPVPDPSFEAFRNLEKFAAMDTLCRQLQSAIDEMSALPGGEQLRRFLQPTGTDGKMINKSEHLNALKRDLKGLRPHSVCPYCAGVAPKTCKGCSGHGWVSKTTWNDAAEEIKVNLR